MQLRGSKLRVVGVAAVVTACALVSGCTGCVWIPDQPRRHPANQVRSTQPYELLPLDTLHVDELECYHRRCQKRFRLRIRHTGQLTVELVPELSSQDDQIRVVLENTRGVVAESASGRGPRSEAIVLTVSATVPPTPHFVRLESSGGPVPFQLSVSLSPDERSPFALNAEPRTGLIDITLP